MNGQEILSLFQHFFVKRQVNEFTGPADMAVYFCSIQVNFHIIIVVKFQKKLIQFAGLLHCKTPAGPDVFAVPGCPYSLPMIAKGRSALLPTGGFKASLRPVIASPCCFTGVCFLLGKYKF